MHDLSIDSVTTPEFDYSFLLYLLREHKAPRDKITRLLKSGLILRVKKGLYVLGPRYGRAFSRHVLANIIYGPSYVGGISALAYWAFIPERTHSMLSMTPNRKKLFETPVGRFEYQYVPMDKFRVSVTRQAVDDQRGFLIATPEKALVECLISQVPKNLDFDAQSWIEAMRFDEGAIRKIRLGELASLATLYQDVRIRQIEAFVRETRRHA